jgi:hypothetical protein
MRILALDFRNGRYAFMLADGKTLKTVSGPPAKGGFSLLAKAASAWGLRRRPPTAVAVLTATGVEKPTWSTMRGAVAVANSLAIAWNAAVFSLEIGGQEKKDELAAKLLEAAASAKPGEWAKPPYGGEPNITKPKEWRV